MPFPNKDGPDKTNTRVLCLNICPLSSISFRSASSKGQIACSGKPKELSFDSSFGQPYPPMLSTVGHPYVYMQGYLCGGSSTSPWRTA